MDTTTTPSLPLTLQELQARLPPAPSNTTVTAAAAALDRISAALAAVTADLDALDTADRAAAVSLADAAERGSADLIKAIAKIGADTRPLLERHRSLLGRGWQTLNGRHTSAEATDPAYLDWRQRCEMLTSEWQRAMATDDEAERFANLIAFTQRLG
jgi:hypothetical protein